MTTGEILFMVFVAFVAMLSYGKYRVEKHEKQGFCEINPQA